MKFLGDELKVAAAYQAYKAATMVNRLHFRLMAKRLPEKLPGIHLVVKMQCEAFARSWQACGGDINAKDEYGETALLDSGRVKNLGITRCLLDSGADVNGSSCRGYTALMAAASRGWAEGVKLLLGRGAEASAKNDIQLTALHQACHVRSSDSETFPESCTELLLEAGADIEAHDYYGNTPLLEAAARSGQNEAVIELLLEHKADVNLVNVQGESALMIAVMRPGHEEKVKLLLQHGADANVVDVKGQSALMICVQRLHVKTAELLLQNAADVNVVDKKGKTVVGVVFDGYWKRWDDVRDMIRILLLAGLSEQNRKDALSLVFSIPDADKEVVRMLSTPRLQTVATAEPTWEE
jgi:uncharacterized protein